jgi:hypothetical protein
MDGGVQLLLQNLKSIQANHVGGPIVVSVLALVSCRRRWRRLGQRKQDSHGGSRSRCAPQRCLTGGLGGLELLHRVRGPLANSQSSASPKRSRRGGSPEMRIFLRVLMFTLIRARLAPRTGPERARAAASGRAIAAWRDLRRPGAARSHAGHVQRCELLAG